MNKAKKRGVNEAVRLVPELRFPEFEKAVEWDLKSFSNFIKLYRGSSPRPIQEYLTQHETGVNWIKIGDTKNAINSIIYQVGEKITPNGAQKSRRVEKGELILANSMSFGKTYELAIEGCIYDGWFVLRKYEKHLNKQFLLQMLNSDFMQNQYKRLSAGGIVQNISSDIVYNSQLFHTSIGEQQKIASCLSSLDELITAQSEKLEALKDHKKGLMQNLFPQEGQMVPNYRFPEFENDGEWNEKKLEELASFSSGGTPSKDNTQFWNGDIPWISASSMHDPFVKKSEHNITQDAVNKGAKIAKKESLLILVRGSMLHKRIPICIATRDVAFNQDVKALKLGDGATNIFLFYLLSSYEKILLELVSATGIGAGKLDTEYLKKLVIYLPPSSQEQQKIVYCLSSLDEQISAEAEKIEQLQLHKKGLMQKLFPKIEN